MTKFSKEEKETHIWIDETDNEYYYVETNMSNYINKFKRLKYELIKEEKEDNRVISAVFKIPKFAISFRKPVKMTRNLTDEQKKQMSERMKKLKAPKT